MLPNNKSSQQQQSSQQLHINDLDETPIKSQQQQQNNSRNSTPKTSGLKPPSSIKHKIPVTPPLSSSSNSTISSNNGITTTTTTNINSTPQNFSPVNNNSSINKPTTTTTTTTTTSPISSSISNTPKFNSTYNNTPNNNNNKNQQSQSGGLVLEEVPSESEYEMDDSQFSDSLLTPKKGQGSSKTPRRWRLVPANCTCLVHDSQVNNSNNSASNISNSNNTNSSSLNSNYCPKCSQNNIDQSHQQHHHNHNHNHQYNNHQQQENNNFNNNFENSYEYNRVTTSTSNKQQNNSNHYSTPLKKVDYKVIPTGDFEKELDLLKNEVSDLEDEFNILKSSKKSEYSNSFGPSTKFSTNITTSTHSSKSPYTSQYSNVNNNSSTYSPIKPNFSTVPPPSQQQHQTQSTTSQQPLDSTSTSSNRFYEQLNNFQKKMEYEINQLNKVDDNNNNNNNNSPLKIYMNDKSIINTPFNNTIPDSNYNSNNSIGSNSSINYNSSSNNNSKSPLIEQIINLLDDLEKEKNQSKLLLKERNEFERLLIELKKLLELKDSDIKNLKLLLSNIENDLKDKHEINSKLMEQLKQYQQELVEKAVNLSTLRELEIEINSMKQQYSQRVSEFDEKSDLIKRGEQEIQQLQNNIQQMKLEINNQEKAESLLNQIVKLKNDYHLLESTSRSHLENEKSKFKLLKDQFDLEKYDYKQQISNLNQLEMEMKRSINELSLNNSRLELMVSNKQKEIDQLENEKRGKILIDALEWDSLNREYRQLKEQNNSTNQKLNQVVFENEKLNQFKNENEKLISDMQIDIENLLVSKLNLEDYINTLLKENSDMKERLSKVHNIVQDSPRKQFPNFNFNQLLSPKSPFLKTKIKVNNNSSSGLNSNHHNNSIGNNQNNNFQYHSKIDTNHNHLMESDINNNSFIKNLNFNDSKYNHHKEEAEEEEEEEIEEEKVDNFGEIINNEDEDIENNHHYQDQVEEEDVEDDGVVYDEYYDHYQEDGNQLYQDYQDEDGNQHYQENHKEEQVNGFDESQQHYSHINGEEIEDLSHNIVNESFTNNDSHLNSFVGSTFEDL